MSVASTPAKRRKTSWHELVQCVNPSLVPGDLCIEGVLARELGDADNFASSPCDYQRMLLTIALGAASDENLITEIVDSVQKSHMQTQTEVDKLRAHILAPSANLKRVDILLAVAGALLDAQFIDANEFRQFVFASPHTLTSSDQPEISSSGVFNTVHKMFERSMLNMRHKEASGVPLLAVFILNRVQKLNEQFVDLKCSADMEYTVMDTKRAGVNPSCDTAMVVTVSSQTDNQPIILYEYKPVVDPRRDYVNVRDLLEALMQGFYCVHFRKVTSIVQCLTDMHTWHFMTM
jgi:hypothetical protein